MQSIICGRYNNFPGKNTETSIQKRSGMIFLEISYPSKYWPEKYDQCLLYMKDEITID